MKVKSFAWVLLTAVLLALVVATVPFVLNGDRVRLALLRQLESETGYKVDAQSMRVRLFPTVTLELSGLLLSDPRSGGHIITANRLQVVLQALPALQGKFVATRLLIEHPSLELRRDRNGAWGIPMADPASTEPAPSGDAIGVLAVVRNIYLTDGLITVFDEAHAEGTRVLHVNGLQAIITEGLPGLSANVQLFGEIPSGADVTTFNLEGTLLRTIRPRSSELSVPSESEAAMQFEGRARLDNLNVQQLAGWAGLGGADKAGVAAHVSTTLRIAPRARGYDVILSEWTVDLADLSVRGEAVLTEIGTPTARFSSTLSSSPFGLKRWLGQLSSVWRSERLELIASQYEADGTVHLQTATITGSLTPASRVEVTGQIQVRDGRCLTGTGGRLIEGLAATILLEADRIRVQDLEARYGPVRLSHSHAVITDLTGELKADVRLSGEVPAAGLSDVLAGTLESRYTRLVQSHFQQATGEIIVAAHLGGPLAHMEYFKLMEAEAVIQDVAFLDPALSMAVEEVNGRVSFSSGTVRVDELTGRMGPARIQAQGRMRMSDEPAYEDLRIDVEADGEKLADLLTQATASNPSATLHGVIRLKAGVSGALHSPRMTGTLDLGGLGVKVDNVPIKSTGVPASVKFAGGVSNNSVLTISRLDLMLPPVHIAGQGTMRLGERPDFDVSFSSGSLLLSKLPRGISLGPLKSGMLDAVVALKGEWFDRTSWQVSGSVRLDDGVLDLEGMVDPIRDVSLRMKLDDDRMEITRLALQTGDSDLRVTGTVGNWLRAPRAALHLESARLDLRSLRVKGSPSQKESAGAGFFHRWLDKGEVDAIVFVEQASHEQLLLTGLSCAIKIKHGQLSIDRISGDTNKGHLSGRLVVHLQESGSGQADASLGASGVPVHPLLALLMHEDVMTGWLSLAGQVRAELGQSGIVATTLSSPKAVRVLIEEGSIKKVPLISNLLKVLNLPALLQGKVDLTRDGLPFNQFRGILTIANGTVSAKELYLSSPILKISGSGQYDLGTDQFDMVLATSPLGSYSDLLKRVPVFGKLLAGERQGLDTALFEVKGSAKDPQIQYLPAESLIRGMKGTAQLAFDILVNAITLPKEMLSMGQEFLSGDDEKDAGK